MSCSRDTQAAACGACQARRANSFARSARIHTRRSAFQIENIPQKQYGQTRGAGGVSELGHAGRGIRTPP